MAQRVINSAEGKNTAEMERVKQNDFSHKKVLHKED